MATLAPTLVLPLTCPACGAHLDHVESSPPPDDGEPTLQVHAELTCPPCDRVYRVVACLVDVSPASAEMAERQARIERLRDAAAIAATATVPHALL